jgi:PKD repeat protein
MDSRLSIKFISLLLVTSVCLLGYVSMSTRADLTGTNGIVTIDNAVIIRQGNGVNYSFADDATISRLEVRSASIELNDWLEIGAETSSGYLTNVLYDYRSDYIKWGSESTDSSAVVTYTIGGLGGVRYDCFKDGTLYRTLLTDPSSQIQFTYGDGFSSHVFVISKSSAPANDLQASFEYTIDGDLVTFTDKSYGSVVNWIWNFGDGAGSTKQDPSHEYKATGKYVVSLTVYDFDGHSSKASTELTLVLGPNFPIQRNPSGWDIFITDDLTVSVSAVGLLIGGAIMYVSAMFIPSIPVLSQKGRKVIGVLMVLAALYFLIILDNSWMGF